MSSIEIVKANSSTLIYSRCFRGPPLSDFETNWIKTESSAHLESYRMKPETKYRRSSYLTIIQKIPILQTHCMRKSDWNAFNVQYTHPNINCTSPRFRKLVCFHKIAKNAFHETRNKCKKVYQEKD